MRRRDVVIIGGGSTGLSTAYYLTKLGVDNISILEKSYVGSGSTGRCGTGIRAQFSDKPTIETMKRSEARWKELADEIGFEFHQTGYLYLHHNEEEVNQYEEIQKLQNSLGVPTEIIEPAEAKELCPYLDTSDVIAASYNPEDGKAHPFEVVAGLKKYFEERNIDLQENTKVTGIELHGEGLARSIIEGSTDLPFDYYDPDRIDRGEFREAAVQMG